jgi:hypothetical protein
MRGVANPAKVASKRHAHRTARTTVNAIFKVVFSGRGVNQHLQRFIVLFELTVKHISADLSLFDASVICTQLERNNKLQLRKGTHT